MSSEKPDAIVISSYALQAYANAVSASVAISPPWQMS